MGKQSKILIVDDDENIRNTMKAILEDEGYLVDTAESGAKQFKKRRKQTTTSHYWIFGYPIWKALNSSN